MPTAQPAITIWFNRQPLELLAYVSLTMGSAQLRAMLQVADSDDLWRISPAGDDSLVTAGMVLTLKDDMAFYSAPKDINGG